MYNVPQEFCKFKRRLWLEIEQLPKAAPCINIVTANRPEISSHPWLYVPDSDLFKD